MNLIGCRSTGPKIVRLFLLAALVAGAALGLTSAQTAQAAVFVVDRTDDLAFATMCTAAANDCYGTISFRSY